MNMKILRRMLTGALIVASVGILSSCKDYGEDINNLQDQINKAALKSELTTAQSTLQKAADDAKKAADDAMAEARKRLSEQDFEDFANRLEKILRDHQDSLKTAFQKNFDQDEALKDTASNIRRDMSGMQSQLKNDIEGAKTYTDDELDKLVKKYKLENVVTMNVKDYTTLQELLAKSDELESLIDKASSLEELEAASRKVSAFTSIVDELYTGVTSVELIATFSDENSIDHYLANYAQTGKSTTATAGSYTTTSNAPFGMAFYKGTIAETSIFGDEVTTQGFISNKVGYQKGAAIKDTVNILVRVSPVNADFSSYQEGDILIVNSQGQALDDYLTVGRPKKYGEVLSYTGTRATNIGSGLWLIPVTMKRGVTIKDYMLATHPDAKLNSADEIADKGRETLYAVAIRNTQKNGTASTQRYAVSTYDLVSSYEDYKPATIFTFQVNDTDVEEIYNRWTGTIIQAEETYTASKQEYMWKQKVNEKVATPATAFDKSLSDEAKYASFSQNVNIGGSKAITPNADGNVAYEERYWWQQSSPYNIIKAEIGEPIYLTDFIGARPQTGSDGVVKAGNYEETRLDYYYVVLDSIGAIESRPSEMNAWLSYQYEGLNKVYKIGEKCTIKVLSKSAQGDIIGFRVYAVNLDGTLADPDGRPFYVQIDQKTEHGTISATDGQTANNIVAKMAADGNYTDNSNAYNFSIFKIKPQTGGWLDFAFTGGNFRIGDYTFSGTFTAANSGTATIKKDEHPNLLAADLNISYWLIKDLYDNGTPKSYATKWSEANYIGIAVRNIEAWVDNSTLDFTLVGYENNNAMNFLDINIRKQMPATADIPADKAVTWYPEWAPSGSTLNIYPKPSQDNTGAAITAPFWNPANIIGYATADVSTFTTNATPSTSYKWVIKGAGENPTDITLTNVTGSTAVIPAGNIGNTYDGIIYYRFPGISLVSATSSVEAYDAAAWTGKIAIGNAVDLLKYKVKAYDAYTDGSGNTVKKSDFFIKWSDVSGGGYAHFWGFNSATTYNYDLGQTKLSDILESNSVSKDLYQANEAGVTGITNTSGNYTFDLTAATNVLSNYSITTNDITLSGNAAAYLKVTGYTSGTIQIEKNATTGPSMQWTGTITIEGRDALGKKHTLVSAFPFTLLP